MLPERHVRHRLGLSCPVDHLFQRCKLQKVGKDVRCHPGIWSSPVRGHGQGWVKGILAPITQHLIAVLGGIRPYVQRHLVGADPWLAAGDRVRQEDAFEGAVVGNKDIRLSRVRNCRLHVPLCGRIHIGREVCFRQVMHRLCFRRYSIERSV